jgi:hypothetical protein
MTTKWDLAADMLQAASDTIRERGTLRDVEGYADTMDTAAKLSGLPVVAVLNVHIATKRARYDRAGDYDSAVDLLAYWARLYVEGITIENAKPPKEPDAAIQALIARAEQDDSDPSLNNAGNVP